MRSVEELQEIAQKAYADMPQDLEPSETVLILSIMLKGCAIAMKNRNIKE